MFSSPNFAGTVISHIKQESSILPNKSIRSKTEKLLMMIKHKIAKNNVEIAANAMLIPIFNLKGIVLDWLAKENRTTSEYFKLIQQQIVINNQFQSNPSLNSILSDIFELYHIITYSIFESNHFSNFKQLGNSDKNTQLSYATIEKIGALPNPQFQYLKKWIDEASKLDFALIVADLVLTEKKMFDTDRIQNELIPFLKETIIRFGAYAIFMNLWYPEADDAGNYFNSMRILAAATAMDHKIGVQPTTIENLYHFIHQSA